MNKYTSQRKDDTDPNMIITSFLFSFLLQKNNPKKKKKKENKKKKKKTKKKPDYNQETAIKNC
jgi:hypothetical protein